MKLTISSLAGATAIEQEVLSVRAADASGSFGIRRGHANLLSVLEIGVVSWLDSAGHEHYCAVRGGILRVSDGNCVHINSREAIADDDLTRLESTIVAEFQRREKSEHNMRSQSRRLELQMVREIMRYLQPGNPNNSGNTYAS